MEASTSVDFELATTYSKLLEGDLYEDELSALTNFCVSGTDGASTTAIDEAFLFNQSDGLTMEGLKSPEPVPLPISSYDQAQESPNTYRRQMELQMEFHNWSTSHKVNAAQETRMEVTLPSKRCLLPKQLPQLFGRNVSLSNELAPISTPGSQDQAVYQGNKRAKHMLNAVPAPIAPKSNSTPALVLAPSSFLRRDPTLAPTPGPVTSGSNGSRLQAKLPPPQVSSNPLVVGGNEMPKNKVMKCTSAKNEVKTTKADVQPKTKARPRRYKRKDPSMTEEEVNEEHRQRNKEHAKNTRLRKKAYIEALKESLNSIVEKRDEDDRKADIQEKVKLQNRNVRFKVMETFLRLRGGKECGNSKAGETLWTSILDDSVTLCRPDRLGSSQVEVVVSGNSNVISDPGEVDLLLNNSIVGGSGKASAFKKNAGVSFEYDCDSSSLLMDGNTCILQWKGITVGAMEFGFPFELPLAGTLRACFNEKTNTLASAALHYDTGTWRKWQPKGFR